jgi:formimidoylglutamate deiminase
VPHGATELGWLPDCVYTGEKFETGLAFFADAVGRITRFSREPADLAIARRLEGQAALPGLVNAHSHSFHRALRGRTERQARPRAAEERLLERMTDEDVFDTARLAFLELLLSGITCVGEFHFLHRMPDGRPWPDVNQVGRAIVRAAHEVGIRIALLNTAVMRGDFRADESAVPPRYRSGTVEAFLRDTEALRVAVGQEFAADEAWLGVGASSLAQVPLDAFKAIAGYARAQRFRLHAHGAATAAETQACAAEYGRSEVALFAEHGIVDKRFTLVDALQLSDDDVKLLGAARAMVTVTPSSTAQRGLGLPPVGKLLAAGAGVAFGTDRQGQSSLLEEARLLEYQLRVAHGQRSGFAADAATTLFQAATVTGARSLGATGGALEVGRPADFFTVNLFDPALAGADPGTLLANVLFALERRAIRDVWVGARQRVANGRHAAHGPIVGRFVEAQRRIWA